MSVYIVFDVETPNRANGRMSAIGISAIKDGIRFTMKDGTEIRV